ncbi:hypothetical protein ACS0TY_035683 [Phlomoides rotata]
MVALPTSLAIPGKKPGIVAREWDRIKAKVVETTNMIKKTGKDDPRRIVHSMKVGFALTLASLFYYFRPLYYGLGESAMWAILTVVVVFEFTVGGTLSKSLNRGGATLLAISLGVGAEYLATLGGKKGEPIILGILVFVVATTSTFTRFFPNVKSRYDYGMMIFILTFSLVAVSGYRVDKIMELARQRLATIVIGGVTCIVVSISICPVWAGQDLHNLVAQNIEKLAAFLDGFGGEFFSFPGDGYNGLVNEDNKAFLIGYKSVLNSKAIEESLVNFAWWEPPHGKFRFRQLWKHYLKVGILTRECARQIETLGECIKSKPKEASEFHKKIQEPCMRMSIESSKALMQLSSTLSNMTILSPDQPKIHIQNSRDAAIDLKNVLESFSLHDNHLQQIMQLFVVSSTLMDIIESIEKISKCINDLSQKAHFKKATLKTEPEKQLHQVFPEDHKELIVIVTIDTHEPSNEKENDK